jgi:hypothetical protein
MHHAGTPDSVPSAESKIVHKAGSGRVPRLNRNTVCRRRSQCSAMRNSVFDSTRPRTRARLRVHPGAGGGYLESRKTFFPGRPSASRRRPFAQGPAHGVRGAFATHGTSFTAGELRSSRRQCWTDGLLGHSLIHNPQTGRLQSLLPVSYLSRYHAPIRNDEKINATTISAVRSQIMRISCV